MPNCARMCGCFPEFWKAGERKQGNDFDFSLDKDMAKLMLPDSRKKDLLFVKDWKLTGC